LRVVRRSNRQFPKASHSLVPRSPQVKPGCGNAARPDPWRGCEQS
jgi:hypothetical protein